MRLIFLIISIFIFSVSGLSAGENNFAIALHGGAGAISKKNMTPEMEKAYRDILEKALRAGYEVLEKGGASLDAVEKAINIMEDSPLFNAGKGAVFTHEGTNELDASIMDGKTLNAGAVAGVKKIKNPISLAKEVMNHSPHVMLVGEGAEQFAKERKIPFTDPSWFYTERRWQSLQKILNKKEGEEVSQDSKHGTVGVAALDKHGNLAAGTSTGGMTNKRFGRVGASPVSGAGTYADNNNCAVSATGHGEFFIRAAVTHDISARMAYGGLSLQDAADQVIQKKLVEMGGSGGVIAVDHEGNVGMSFNTEGMYRAYMKGGGQPVIKIYRD